MGRPIEEKWALTNSDTSITEADGTASVFSDVWKYQVPTGVGHVLLTEHTLSMYLEDASGSEVSNGTCRVSIEVRDASEQDSKTVFGPALYVTVKEFQDVAKVAKLNIANPVQVTERMWIVVRVNDDAVIDASDSYFEISMNRIRKTLT